MSFSDSYLEGALKRSRQNEANRKSYHKHRELLFDALGRVCKCGSVTALEFDVIVPVGEPGGHHARMSSSSRIAFYKREHKRDNLQVLCKSCNSAKKDTVDLFVHQRLQPTPTLRVVQPF